MRHLPHQGFELSYEYELLKSQKMIVTTSMQKPTSSRQLKVKRSRGKFVKTEPKKNELSERAWQRMLSGRRLDILNPSPLDIEIEDIAHGLARVSRWNGQTRGKHSFSVAQHSVLVERLVGPTLQN